MEDIPYTKYFNKKRFVKLNSFRTKLKTDRIVKGLKDKGSQVRIVKTRKGNTIYYRNDNFV